MWLRLCNGAFRVFHVIKTRIYESVQIIYRPRYSIYFKCLLYLLIFALKLGVYCTLLILKLYNFAPLTLPNFSALYVAFFDRDSCCLGNFFKSLRSNLADLLIAGSRIFHILLFKGEK